jgi:hypothetical protein
VIYSRPQAAPAFAQKELVITDDRTVDPAVLTVELDGQLILAKPSGDPFSMFDLFSIVGALGHGVDYSEIH